MRFRQHPSLYVFSLIALAFAVLAGILIPLATGGNLGAAQPNWAPPPVKTVDAKGGKVRATATPSLVARRTIVPTNTMPPKPSPTATRTIPSAASPTSATPARAAQAPTATTTAPPMARILKGPTNLRAGAGTGYTVLGVANEGDQYPITGRSEDSRWVQVCCISGTAVWVSATLTKLPAAVESFPLVR